MKPIIFTDLDGTLLRADDYSYDEALPALERIHTGGIPLVFCTSKSAAEVEPLRAALANAHPFITENGGGVFVPHGYFPSSINGARSGPYDTVVLGTPYSKVVAALNEIRIGLGVRIRGFNDMSAKEVAELTGLGLREAGLAKQRDFDEPFVVEGNGRESEQRVFEEIEKRGLRWTRGRLCHILGEHDKGRAVRILTEHFRSLYHEITTIGLGDALNDVSMLTEVDRAVLVAKPGGGHEDIRVEGVVRAAEAGPAGWNESVLHILDSLGV